MIFMPEIFDAIIVGAGPSGAIAAMYLAKAGKNVLLIDKANFPRDKICGDAQGRKAAAILKELGIYEDYTKIPGQKIYGIVISSPNGKSIDLDVEDRKNPAPGYCHKRQIFDNYLFESAAKTFKVKFKVFNATDILIEDGKVSGVIGKNESGQDETLRAKIILGCDGANSIVARKFNLNKNPSEHFLVATRGYYKNVRGMSDRIEIHMIKDLIPGYFWVFPLSDNEVNVGLGMIVKDKVEKGVNLVSAQNKVIAENPLFKERFKDSKLQGQIVAWNLPAASWHRKCYGNGFLLLGDAASLIDPLSGEGVGNAMISGRVAAAVAVEALQKNDFSENFLKKYDIELWKIIGEEVKASYRLQKIGKMFPHLINVLVEKASTDPKFRAELEKRLPYSGGKIEMGTPDFLKMLGHEAEEIPLEVEE